MKDLVRVHAVVNGKVQGVGFRAFTQDQATQKGIVGWVRNREDGSVELEAEGPRGILDDFLKVLKQGPDLSQVEHITVDWKAANRQTKGFTVLRS